MTRTPIPSAATQAAINAANDCRRLSTALTTSATFNELLLAEQARVRAMEYLRSLGPQIRAAKAAVKQADREHEADRRIVERDRMSVAGLEIPA